MRDPIGIIISGTPGTGKTTISKRLGTLLPARVLNLTEIIISEKLTAGFDKKRETYIADFKKLIPYLKNFIQTAKKEQVERVIIEGHYADVVPNEYINQVFVFRCNPDELRKRLEERGYTPQKVSENVQAEILGSCTNYMIEKDLEIPIMEIDTSNISISETSQLVFNIIKGNIKIEGYIYGKIDWLEFLNNQDRLMEFFD